MSCQVYLTAAAARDLEDIYDYVHRHDSPVSADQVLARIESVYQSLAENPERGSRPSELLDIGIREYREIFFKPYRIIYQIRRPNVFVQLIADGRRDMQTLLLRRLLQV